MDAELNDVSQSETAASTKFTTLNSDCIITLIEDLNSVNIQFLVKQYSHKYTCKHLFILHYNHSGPISPSIYVASRFHGIASPPKEAPVAAGHRRPACPRTVGNSARTLYPVLEGHLPGSTSGWPCMCRPMAARWCSAVIKTIFVSHTGFTRLKRRKGG